MAKINDGKTGPRSSKSPILVLDSELSDIRGKHAVTLKELIETPMVTLPDETEEEMKFDVTNMMDQYDVSSIKLKGSPSKKRNFCLCYTPRKGAQVSPEVMCNEQPVTGKRWVEGESFAIMVHDGEEKFLNLTFKPVTTIK